MAKGNSGGQDAPFEPTGEQRNDVQLMVGYGMTYLEICTLIRNPRTRKPISVNTLQKTFREELSNGAAMVKSRVIGNLVRRATANHPSSVVAAIWITKARYGWKSTERIEHVDAGNTTGVMVVPAAESPTAWVARQRGKNAKRQPPQAAAS